MKLLLIHIPRTAGNSIHLNGRIPVKCYGHKFACDIPDLKKYYSFAVVRNPYDRFMSSYYFYRDIYKGGREIRQEIQKYKTFKKFVKGFDKFKFKNDHQFIPQHKYFFGKNGNRLTDWFLFYENLDDEWNYLCKLVNIEPFELPRKNKSTHKNWKHEYTEKMKDIVFKLYKEDFRNFEYEP